jgi:hypothetical protein
LSCDRERRSGVGGNAQDAKVRYFRGHRFGFRICNQSESAGEQVGLAS